VSDGPTHQLKTWHEPFQAVWDGKKFHELRKNDRGYTTNDLLILREYHAPLQRYSGRTIFAVPTYITRGGAFGLPDDMVVMSIRVIAKHEDWWDAKPIPDFDGADVMTVKEFLAACQVNAFTDDDGVGYFAESEAVMTDCPAVPSRVLQYPPPAKFTHVVWYNK